MLHATVSPGAQVRLPWRPDFNALVYVLSGELIGIGSLQLQYKRSDGAADDLNMIASPSLASSARSVYSALRCNG